MRIKTRQLPCFWGEKIEVNEVAPEPNSMVKKFIAAYKILEKVYGTYDMDTIIFIRVSKR